MNYKLLLRLRAIATSPLRQLADAVFPLYPWRVLGISFAAFALLSVSKDAVYKPGILTTEVTEFYAEFTES